MGRKYRAKSWPKDMPIPEVDESNFVSRMFVPRLTFDHYNPDVVIELAKYIKEKYNIQTDDLIRAEMLEIVDGKIVGTESLL